jgi:hypothetical protein
MKLVIFIIILIITLSFFIIYYKIDKLNKTLDNSNKILQKLETYENWLAVLIWSDVVLFIAFMI